MGISEVRANPSRQNMPGNVCPNHFGEGRFRAEGRRELKRKQRKKTDLNLRSVSPSSALCSPPRAKLFSIVSKISFKRQVSHRGPGRDLKRKKENKRTRLPTFNLPPPLQPFAVLCAKIGFRIAHWLAAPSRSQLLKTRTTTPLTASTAPTIARRVGRIFSKKNATAMTMSGVVATIGRTIALGVDLRAH